MKINAETRANTRLTAADGHVFDTYLASPGQTPRGALVVIQDAFGLGHYIRSVCDSYCADGYVCVAPALYDRQQRGAVFDHSPESHKQAARCRASLNWDHVLADVSAAIAHVSAAGPVGILGFCVGGSVAWLTGASLPVAAAACYYGKDIVGWLDRPISIPSSEPIRSSRPIFIRRDTALTVRAKDIMPHQRRWHEVARLRSFERTSDSLTTRFRWPPVGSAGQNAPAARASDG